MQLENGQNYHLASLLFYLSFKICSPINLFDSSCLFYGILLITLQFKLKMESLDIKQCLNIFAVLTNGFSKVPQIRQLLNTFQTKGLSFINLNIELFWYVHSKEI